MQSVLAAAAVFSAGAMLFSAGTSHAQDPGVVTPLDEAFSRLDTNNDGVISLSEADRSVLLSANFATADTDADNVIDRVEFGAFQALISGGPGGGGGGLLEGITITPEAVPDAQSPGLAPSDAAPPGAGNTAPPAAGSSVLSPPTASPDAEAQPFATPGTAGATPPTTSSPGTTPPTFSAPGRTPPTTSSPGVTPTPPS